MSLAHFPFHTKPLYLQLAEQIAEKISAGEYAVGSQLPNEQSLAQQFGLSNGSVRKALDTLEGKGLLMRQQGRGTFVCDPKTRPLQLQLSRAQAEALLAALPGEIDVILSPIEKQIKDYVFDGSSANGKRK